MITVKCDCKNKYTITPLTDLPVGDNSLQYRITSNHGGFVDFGVLDGELCAHSWHCPEEGRALLKALEKYASEQKLKLTIPTVLDGRLEKILKDNGYIMRRIPYMDDICELWSKEVIADA